MNDPSELLKKQPVLLFDGECGFCNRTVQFFLARENKKKQMHFAPLQSEEGIALKRYFEIPGNVDSLILVKGHRAYIKSCAALRLTLFMRWPWPLLLVFLVIPPVIRNLVYDAVARRRMRLFGRVESCALLKQEDRGRFLSM